MPEDIKSKITKKILRKLAVRGLIALATGGTGWLVFEGIELAVDAITAAQTIAEVAVETPIKGINLENYPDSLISDIFQMCRYFREHDIFGNIRDLQAYNDYRKKVLGGWRSFKNV